MSYVSTRGTAPQLSFPDVLLAGLASDGGLYVPEVWPQMSRDEIAALSGRPYADIAYEVMSQFTRGSVDDETMRTLVNDAYAGFHHDAIAPLVQIGPSEWVLELFHGPTLAFKDFAMQIVSRLMDRELERRGERATVVAATSGDTGGAAIEAFRGLERIDIFVLHPHGRVSDVQRRQMTTARENNVHNIAIDGTFDDCQALVKAMFNDTGFREKVQLAGVNSINWARIMAQTVYYFSSALALGGLDRSVAFSVPTGNFGDIFAGYVARQMGLPIERLIVATNVNDILARTIQSGDHSATGVHASSSPSMDIQISSNFERMLFEQFGRSSDRIVALMKSLQEDKAFKLSLDDVAGLQSLFSAYRVDEAETVALIRSVHDRCGYVLDPHTAVGVGAARRENASSDVAMVTLATAHPAKFPDVVREAIGRDPEQPERVRHLMNAEEHFDRLANDLGDVSDYIESRTGAQAASV